MDKRGKRGKRKQRAPLKPLQRKRDGGFRGDHLRVQNRKHWEPEEVEAFFAAIRKARNPYWEAYFKIQYFWGCRISEPALIGLHDVNLEGQPAEIVITRLKKNAGNAETPEGVQADVHEVPAALVETLTAHLEFRANLRESAWLFPSPKRRAWKPTLTERMAILRRDAHDPKDAAVSRMSAHTAFKDFADAADIPDTRHLRRTHVLRHTRATLLVAAEAPLDYVKRFLGHEDLRTTEKYVHAAKQIQERYDAQGLNLKGLDGIL